MTKLTATPKVGEEYTIKVMEPVYRHYAISYVVSQKDLDKMAEKHLTFREYCKEYFWDLDVDENEYDEYEDYASMEIEDVKITKDD